MTTRLFTIIAEFRGTTSVSQVSAPDQRGAALAWAASLRTVRPFGRAPSYLARSIADRSTDFPPVAIIDVSNVWCVTGSCGGDFMLADIIETVQPPAGIAPRGT